MPKKLMSTLDAPSVTAARHRTTPVQLTKEETKILRTVLEQEVDYQNLPLKSLQIDMSYQDRPRDALVNQIAAHYNKLALGVIIVSQRPDGSYWICDGATRKKGMDLGGRGNNDVLCQVIRTNGPQQESLLFKYFNVIRKAVPIGNRINAEGIAGLDGGLRKIILRTGYTLIGKSKNTLKGITFIIDAFELDKGESMEKALFAFKNSWSPEVPDGTAVLGLAIFYHTQRRPVDEQVRRVLLRLTPDKLDEMVAAAWGGGAKKGAKLRPSSRPRYIAKTIAKEINCHSGKSGKVDVSAIDYFYDKCDELNCDPETGILTWRHPD